MMFIEAKKISAYLQLMRIKQPIGTLLLLWPTLWGLWFAARGMPPISILVLFIIGVVVTRSAGCVFNDITDRHFDGHVTRTRERPLVTGRINLGEALSLFFILSVLALCCVLFLNRLTLGMAFIAMLLMILYPFMKRITYWPQVVLGAAFSWGVLMAYTAVTNTLPWQAIALFFIALLWTVSYDTIYAMVDREDDVLIGIKSTAVRLKNYDVIFVTTLHVIVLVGLLLFAGQQKLSLLFYPAWSIALGLTFYQTHLIASREPEKCFKAFLNNHWFGAAIFVGIILSLS
jgi:4-hydroxybenzoate polyprenyltransferase